MLISSCFLLWYELSSQARIKKTEVYFTLLAVCNYGLHFLLCQYLEYTRIPFTITDSVFGGLFFCITGLHALHIVIGLGLLISLLVNSTY